MSRHPFFWSSLTIWICSALICIVKSGHVKNGELPGKNGWQPLVTYDNVENVSPPSNYAAYTISHFDSEREANFKISKPHRKSVDTIHQYDYTPPSILGSFSIFGHSISKNRKGDESKGYRDALNTNEYDFLVPPPRQRIEPYQKIKISGDAYGGSQYRDTIYTPMNTQFTFISAGASSPPSSSSVVKKLPGIVPSRDQLAHHPLRQYQTASESYKSQSPTQSAWMSNIRDNMASYHLPFRQYSVHSEASAIADGGNHYYTQIGHPPVFKSPYDAPSPPKPAVENPNEYVTAHHPGNLYAVVTTPNNRYVEPHYGFDQNSPGKQHFDTSDDHLPNGPASDNYYSGRKKNTTPSWLMSTSKEQLRDILPKLNKPVQFNRANNATRHKAPAVTENKLKTQILPEKIAPITPKLRQETPESISLKHFNEQQFLLQQQLLERDRLKLEEFQSHKNPITSKPTEKYEETESPGELNGDKEFPVYEAVKLTNSERRPPAGQLPPKHYNVNYSKKQVDESTTRESSIFDYSTRHPIRNLTEADVSTGKRKKVHNHRIVVSSEISHYDDDVIHNERPDTDPGHEKINNSIKLENTSPELVVAVKPTFITGPEVTSKNSQTFETPPEGSAITPVNVNRTVAFVIDTTPRRSTTMKTRLQNRGSTRRRRPPLEPEVTSSLSSIQSIAITTENIPDVNSNHRLITTPSYYSTNKSTIINDIDDDRKNETESVTVEQEEKTNTVTSEELTTLFTRENNEATKIRKWSTQSPINEENHEEVSSVTHAKSPEEVTTSTMEIMSSIMRNYTSEIAPLENLFNLTEKYGDDETVMSTQLSEWASSLVGEKKINGNNSNSPDIVDVTTRPTYRLRPMKMTNNTRPRFSVKDYKSRLDYRNRLSQASTTQSTSTTTQSTQLKGSGRYKYTPRYYTKSKSSTPSYLPKSINVSDLIEGKRSKIPGYRPYNTAIQRKKIINSTTEATNTENKLQVNNFENENLFVQPIRRRPQIKTSGQFAQILKKHKNNIVSTDTTVQDSVLVTTEPIPKRSDFTEEAVAVSTTITINDKGKKQPNNTMDDITVNSPDREKEIVAVTTENFSPHASIQSDEEAFARASLSVADLTSSASALYNKPGMFKAVSVMPVFESDFHRKKLTPIMDEPSLPIEAFFRELSNKEK
ncbi:uncharacterized protein LOC135166776 [Diachasmimorpha longicaudata]|uniref:uncharacterized protein LOC135166776 n=1 Tax=Diachasmimorpha longicaudata TaxID=58733 RepID=UPI0030B91AFB